MNDLLPASRARMRAPMKMNTLTIFCALLFCTFSITAARGQGLGSLMSPSATPEDTVPEADGDDADATSEPTAWPKPTAKPSAKAESTPAAKAEVKAETAGTPKPPIVVTSNTVQKIAQAGIQFEVPKGWQISEVPGPSGPTYRLISKDGAGFFFVTTTGEEVAARLAAMREAVEKKAKKFKAGSDKENLINGLKYIARADSLDDGASVSITGYVQGKEPVIFMRAGEAAPMKANAAALDGIFASLKKME